MIKFISRLNLQGSRIDRDKGIIKGVSLIALGEARGHDKKIDHKTLESVIECAKTYGDGLRVKFNPSTFQHGAGSLAGFIPPSSLRIEEDKSVGDLHLYKNFPGDAKEYLYEIAERTPGNIGLSIEFSGDDEEIKGEKFARCDQIYAATIVDLPAANPTGLFAEGDGDGLTKAEERIKSAAKEHGKEISEESMIMDEETIQKLATATATATAEALKPILQKFAEDNGNGNGNGDKKKKKENGDEDEGEASEEEMAAAGVAPTDDAATKQTKLADYRASLNKPIASMSARELIETVTRGNIQFFREVGNRPIKTNAEPRRISDDPFEARVKSHMAAGAKSRGLAIVRARRDSPSDYNEWMAKKHPNTQTMAVKK